MAEDEDSKKEKEITIDFSKIAGKFRKKKTQATTEEKTEETPPSAPQPPALKGEPKKAEKEITIDFSGFLNKVGGRKKLIVYTILILILLMSAWVRFIPAQHYYLAAMDPYWHYRHTRNVYEHGYVGDELRIVDGQEVAYDMYHNAPTYGPAVQEFYPYFSAYSYKYFGRYFADDLLTWHKLTPAIFGVLAVLCMFLLVRQLIDEKAGLAAAFMYSLSGPFLMRSVSGFADTDAPIAFFTILTLFLLIRAWDRQSFIYAGFAGISMLGFAGTWGGGYAFIPLLAVVAAVLFFLYKAARAYLAKESIMDSFKESWKKYAVVLVFLAVGLILIAIFYGSGTAAFWNTIFGFTQTKAYISGATSDAPNVMLTVSEMNPPTTHQLISRIHIAPILLSVIFLGLLPLGLWKKLKGKMYHFIIIALWAIATLYASTVATRFIEMAVVPITILAGIAVAYLISWTGKKKILYGLAAVAFIIALIFFIPNTPQAEGAPAGLPYFQQAQAIAESSGPSLNQNWLNLFEWMKTQTPERSIMASWWDPGHAVAALGERPVVADGSQNPAHVHDLGLIFTSTNESEALEILDEYNVSYFFVSSDLIAKYSPISFLGRGFWDNYPIIRVADVKQTGNDTMVIYTINSESSIVLNVNANGDVVSANFHQGYNTHKIDRVLYFKEGNGILSDQTGNDTVDAMIYVFPDYSQIIYMEPRIEDNMLTRLYFLNGQGLEHFELVQNFGGEIKVYKVNYA